MPAHPRPRRIAWPVIALAAAGVIGGVVTAVANLGGGDGGRPDGGGPDPGAAVAIERTGSMAAPEAPPVVPGSPPATGWRIRYLVTAVASQRHLEVVTVLPPFASRTVVHEGTSATTPVVTERELDLGVLATANQGAEPAVLAPEPQAAGPRPGAILEDAVRLGLAERRERRLVAGRACQVYRTSGARDGSQFLPVTDPDDTLDLCVDSDGLVLEEWQVFGGKGIRQRVAVAVEAPADVEPDALRQVSRERFVAPRDGGGSLRPAAPDSRPQGMFFALPGPPEGFTFLGRFGAVPPQPGFADPEKRGSVFATTVDVFVRGADLLVTEAGGTLDLSPPWETDPANPTVALPELPQLGTAEVVLGLSGGELRALVGDSGRFVKVRGTLGVADLEAVMRSLQVYEDGTGLVFADR